MNYTVLEYSHTIIIREQGMEAWSKLQDQEKEASYTYSDAKNSIED